MQVFFAPFFKIIERLDARRDELFPARGYMTVDGAGPRGPMWWTFDRGFIAVGKDVGFLPGQHVPVVSKSQDPAGDCFVLDGDDLLYARRGLWTVGRGVARSLVGLTKFEAEALAGTGAFLLKTGAIDTDFNVVVGFEIKEQGEVCSIVPVMKDGKPHIIRLTGPYITVALP
jgi:hypothetical protein